ncbi:MAG: efflux RND transporter periplasmic adaptor subunit [Planctomycetota bacterium]
MSPASRCVRTGPTLASRLLAPLALLLPLALLVIPACGSRSDAQNGATFTVKRGKLTVSVTEGGSVDAIKSVNIASEVEGQSRILTVVPEGSFVKEGQVLVELDSADLRDSITAQEITFQNVTSSYAQAASAYDIQLNQNESNIKAAELKVKFAEMDVQKYLGEISGGQMHLETASRPAVQDPSPDAQSLAPATQPQAGLQSLIESPDLGGEASQRRMKLESDIDLANEECKRAQTRLASTRKLYEKKFVTTTDLEADELALKRSEYSREQATVALEIFKQYEFPRQVEQLVSDYHEAERDLERVKAKADSELAKSKAGLSAAQQTLQLQTSKLDKLRDQLKKTTIRARQDGMVIYSSSSDQSRRGSTGVLIEPGATIRYQQNIISLPDTSAMKVVVNVHEASIERIKTGMPAVISVDAFPDRSVPGRVTKVAVLADSTMGWLNPDLKTYKTEVALSEVWEGLKPGMSAQVRIIVAELPSVLSVPIQAVVTRRGRTVCYVLASTKPVETPVEVGYISDSFAEIRSGLKEGDVVLLAPPAPREEEKAKEPGAESPAPPAATTTPQAATEKPPAAAPETPAPDAAAPRAPADDRAPGERPRGQAGQGRMRMDPERLAEMLKTMTPEQKKQMLDRLKSLPDEERAKFEKILNDPALKE